MMNRLSFGKNAYSPYKVIMSVLCLPLIMTFLLACQNQTKHETMTIDEGHLRLAGPFEKGQTVRLDGDWVFYKHELIHPDAVKPSDFQLINVPGSWNRLMPNAGGHGFGTYQLTITSQEPQIVGIRVPRIFTSYQLWLDDQIAVQAGVVSDIEEAATPHYRPQIARLELDQGENVILLQTANFSHRSGGLLESLSMGSYETIRQNREMAIARDLFLFGSLFVIGLYHIVLWLFRKKSRSQLFFGFFSVLVGIRTLFVGERFIQEIWPSMNWEFAHKVQTLTFYLGVPLIMMFFCSLYKDCFPRNIARILLIVSLPFSALVVLTPARIFTLVNPAYQAVLLATMVILIVGLTRILRRNRKDALLMTLGATFLILTTLYDMIYLNVWFNDHGSAFIRTLFLTGNLSSFGQLIFVIANSIILARHFAEALEKEEIATKELKNINAKLDERVMQRTKDLQESQAKIENQKDDLERANETLKRMSRMDSLTGLWNRRHYNEQISIEWFRSMRQQQPIALMIIDIDDFKQFNDRFGHLEGDMCLATIGDVMQKAFRRANDLVVRYGGEEFLVIMKDTSYKQAVEHAERLRRSVERLDLCDGKENRSITISIGVSSHIPQKGETFDLLFRKADQALYDAKEAGKNRVVSARLC